MSLFHVLVNPLKWFDKLINYGTSTSEQLFAAFSFSRRATDSRSFTHADFYTCYATLLEAY